jgi:hypothetical protein
MDCPYTGNGNEFSSGELDEAALADCMLLSMGVMAMLERAVERCQIKHSFSPDVPVSVCYNYSD